MSLLHYPPPIARPELFYWRSLRCGISGFSHQEPLVHAMPDHMSTHDCENPSGRHHSTLWSAGESTVWYRSQSVEPPDAGCVQALGHAETEHHSITPSRRWTGGEIQQIEGHMLWKHAARFGFQGTSPDNGPTRIHHMKPRERSCHFYFMGWTSELHMRQQFYLLHH